MALEYVIYADESISSGSYFSNFYGGLLVRSTDLLRVQALLSDKAQELNLFRELKWSKVTSQYLPRYMELHGSLFFDLVAEDAIKVRIMFTHNFHRAVGLTAEHRENRYHILYYHFLNPSRPHWEGGEGRRRTSPCEGPKEITPLPLCLRTAPGRIPRGTWDFAASRALSS